MSNNYLIVVGVGGSEGGRRALHWAAREAATRGGAVQAVTVWSWDGMEYGPIAAARPQEAAERASRMLDHEIKELIARTGSSLPVAAEVIEGCIRRATCPVVLIPVPAEHQQPATEPVLRT